MSKEEKILSENELLNLSEIIVKHYAYAIPPNEIEDVRMSIVEKYLAQEDKINRHFHGQSKKSTYAYAILNRMCCSILRKEKKHWQKQHTYHEDLISTGPHKTTEQFIIEDEIQHLRKHLIMLNNQFKSVIFIAFYYVLSAKEHFVKVYDKSYKKHGLLSLLDPDSVHSKSEIFNNLAKVQNKVELKTVKADAVRMWLNKNIKHLIQRMNGPFGRANYEQDSFRILFEYYYDKE